MGAPLPAGGESIWLPVCIKQRASSSAPQAVCPRQCAFTTDLDVEKHEAPTASRAAAAVSQHSAVSRTFNVKQPGATGPELLTHNAAN